MLSFFIQMNGSLVLVPGVERNSSHLGISDPPRISASHDTLIALGVHTSFSSIPINISVIDSFCQFSSLSTKTELEQRQAILPNSYHPAVLGSKFSAYFIFPVSMVITSMFSHMLATVIWF